LGFFFVQILNPTPSTGGRTDNIQALLSPDIDCEEQEQPDNIDKVPIPRRRFKPGMLFRREIALDGAKKAHGQKDRADNNMRPVKSGRHEKGAIESVATE
jgi:hypothetical protein